MWKKLIVIACIIIFLIVIVKYIKQWSGNSHLSANEGFGNRLDEWKLKIGKLPSFVFILFGVSIFGLLFFIAKIFVGFVYLLIPIFGFWVHLCLFIVIVIFDKLCRKH